MKSDPKLAGFSNEQIMRILFTLQVFTAGLCTFASADQMPENVSLEFLLKLLEDTGNGCHQRNKKARGMMKITIINGAPAGEWGDFETALAQLKVKLAGQHDVEIFTVRDLNIKYCVGCFGCWIKTPAAVRSRTIWKTVLKSLIHADLQICVSPAVAGFVSSETKKVMDREIPMVLRLFEFLKANATTPVDMISWPDLGIILMDDGNLDEETKEIVFDSYDRLVKKLAL